MTISSKEITNIFTAIGKLFAEEVILTNKYEEELNKIREKRQYFIDLLNGKIPE